MPQTASDALDAHYLSVGPDTPVEELGRRLLEERLDGAVVLEDGKLVGVVTAMDLIFQQKQVHLPTFITLLDAVIPLESRKRTLEELKKIGGGSVRDIMSRKVEFVRGDAPLDRVATMMVEHHLSMVPVVDGETLRGVVTRQSMLKTVATPPA